MAADTSTADLRMIKFGRRHPSRGVMTSFAVVATGDMPGAFTGRRNTIMTTDTSGASDGGMVEHRRA